MTEEDLKRAIKTARLLGEVVGFLAALELIKDIPSPIANNAKELANQIKANLYD